MKSLLLKVTTLVLIASVPVLGQTEPRKMPRIEGYRFDFTGGGARAEGMGKAFIGLSNDNTAGSWNPAGLYEIGKPIISLSYGSLVPRGYSTGEFATIPLEPGQPVQYQSIRADHNGSVNNLSGFHFVAPVRIKGHPFVGSFSYTRNFDDYQEALVGFQYPVIYSFNGVELDTMQSTLNFVSTLKGGMNTINIGFGTRFWKNVSAGIVVNVYTGRMVRDEIMTNHRPDRRNIYGQYLAQDTASTTLDSNKFAGYNATIGFKLNGERLSAGLVIRTPFYLTVNTVRSIFNINQYNGLTRDAGTDTTYYQDLKLKYQMPLMLGLGVSYKVNEATTVDADLEYRPYSGKKVRVRDSLFLDPGGNNTEFYTDVKPGWKNVFLFRVGGEHFLINSSPKVPVRLGFGYLPEPAPDYQFNVTDSTVEVSSTSTLKTYQFSGGIGLWWKQIHLDVAYTYTTMDWGDIYLLDHYGLVQAGAPVTQKSHDHHINATFTGYF